MNKPASWPPFPGGLRRRVFCRNWPRASVATAGDADLRCGVVHRLDKDTSGVCCLPRIGPLQRFLSQQFQNNTVEKQYLALVIGRPVDGGGRDRRPHWTGSQDAGKMMVHRLGKPARTL